jgi:hypothetical protein
VKTITNQQANKETVMTEDNERYWAEQAEKGRGDAETKRKVYRCRDRMCGGEDCATCYGEQAASDFVNQEEQ